MAVSVATPAPVGVRGLVFLVNTPKYFLSHRLHLARGARAAGHRVGVITSPGPGLDRIAAEGFTVHTVPFSRGGASLAELLAWHRALRESEPGLMHLVGLKAVVLGGALLRWRERTAAVFALTGLGHVFTSQGLRARVLRLLVRASLRVVLSKPCSVTLFQNADDLDLFVRLGLVVRERTRLVRGSGVELSEFPVRPPPAGPVVVAFVARLLGDKGLREFVAAARQCRAEGLTARFVVAGGHDAGNPSAITRAEMNAWVDEGIIEHLGEVGDVAAVYQRSHIVCLPSYREGLPKTLLEAAASGRPMVATDVPGCREIVIHGTSGLLVPARDASALAGALGELIRRPELRTEFGTAARAAVEANFSAAAVLTQTLAIYRELVPLVPEARPME